jgi:hypothetical protein
MRKAQENAVEGPHASMGYHWHNKVFSHNTRQGHYALAFLTVRRSIRRSYSSP